MEAKDLIYFRRKNKEKLALFQSEVSRILLHYLPDVAESQIILINKTQIELRVAVRITIVWHEFSQTFVRLNVLSMEDNQIAIFAGNIAKSIHQFFKDSSTEYRKLPNCI